MPRGKIQMRLIGDARARAKSFKTRKDGLKKKASEPEILCGVDIALVIGGALEFGSAAVVDRYRRLPAEKRARHTHRGYLDAELGKARSSLAEERRMGPRYLAAPSAPALEGMDLEELLASIDAALVATARRREELGVPEDDAAVVVDAVPLGPGVPFAGEVDDDDMEAWIDELTWHGDELHPLNASTAQPAPGAQYNDGVDVSNASMTQPAYGVQYINSGSLKNMGGNQCLEQMGGNGESEHGEQSWNAYQLHNTVSYGFEYTDSSYSDMEGCPQMPAPSNANAYDGCWFNQAMSGSGTDESSRDAVVPVDCYHHHSSLDTTGNHVYTPPELSSMAANDCFTDVSSIGYNGSFMGESSHEYGNLCLADYFQCPDASQQFEEEPLHYLSDVAEGRRLRPWDWEGGLSVPSHNSCGAYYSFSSGQSQSGLGHQDTGVQQFWVMERAAGFN